VNAAETVVFAALTCVNAAHTSVNVADAWVFALLIEMLKLCTHEDSSHALVRPTFFESLSDAACAAGPGRDTQARKDFIMPVPEFLPSKEADLLAWSTNFDAKITATPTIYGVTSAMATVYTALHLAFATKYAESIEPTTNSKATIAAKNLAKQNLVNGPGGARALVALCQAFPGMNDALRAELSIRPRDVEPSPAPVPDDAPQLNIVSTVGRKVTLRLRDPKNPDRRGKPEGIQGATVLTHVGTTAPQDPLLWTFAINTSKTTFDIDFPVTIPAESKVWITAFWFNSRKDNSPPSTPVATRLADTVAMPIAS